MPPDGSSIKVGPTVNLREREQIRAQLEELARTDPRTGMLKTAEFLGADEARPLLDQLEGAYRQRIDALEERNGALDQQLKDLQAPPLRSGVYLKPSPEDPDKLAIIGVGGTRMEVALTCPAPGAPDDLVGCEVWVSGENQVIKFCPTSLIGEAAEVVERLEDGRLRIRRQASDEQVLEVAPRLAAQPITPGDSVLIDASLGIAFEKLHEREKTALEPERIPDVTYDQVGGLSSQLTKIREAIEFPYLYRDLYQDYQLKRPKGILLFGPPGCGKTLIAKAIANSIAVQIRQRLEQSAGALAMLVALPAEPGVRAQQYRAWLAALQPSDQHRFPPDPELAWEACQAALKAFLEELKVNLDAPAYELDRLQTAIAEDARGYFLTINGPEILNKWVGETESSIRRIFTLARKKATRDTPVVIFFDELESMFSRRGSHISSDMESTVVPQLLSEIDGMDELNDVIIIGASNRYDLIDPAVLRPGRLDVKIEVGRPEAQAAKDILAKYLTPQLPVAATTLAQHGGDRERAVQGLIDQVVAVLYHPESHLLIFEKAARREASARSQRAPVQRRKPVSEIVSGAMFASIVARAKQSAIRREIAGGEHGLCWDPDFVEAVEIECTESKEQYIGEVRETRDVIDTEAYGVEVHLAWQLAADARPALTRWFAPKHRPWQAGSPTP